MKCVEYDNKCQYRDAVEVLGKVTHNLDESLGELEGMLKEKAKGGLRLLDQKTLIDREINPRMGLRIQALDEERTLPAVLEELSMEMMIFSRVSIPLSSCPYQRDCALIVDQYFQKVAEFLGQASEWYAQHDNLDAAGKLNRWKQEVILRVQPLPPSGN